MDLIKEAQIESARENYVKAINLYKKVLFNEPRNAKYYVEIAELYVKLCDFSTAISYFRKSLSIEKDDIVNMRYKSFLVLLGLVYYETGRYWDTICLLSEAIDIFALDGESWLYRSLSYFHLKEYQEALRDANTCIKINDIFIYRAKLYQLLGMEQKAKEDYSVAIRINPEHEEVKIYIKESKEKALKYYNDAIEFSVNENFNYALNSILNAMDFLEDDITFLLLKSYILRKLNKIKASLIDLDSALKLNPTEDQTKDIVKYKSLTLCDEAISLYNSKRFQDAIEILHLAIQNEKDTFGNVDGHLYLSRGDCFRMIKKNDLALADYHQALILIPKRVLDIKLRISIIYNTKGEEYYNEMNYDHAKAAFTQAIDSYNKLAKYFLNRGLTNELLYNYEQAYLDFTEVIKLDPNNRIGKMKLSQLTPIDSKFPRITSKKIRSAK